MNATKTTNCRQKPQREQYDYDLFQQSFEEDFGCEYPGAKWDNVPMTGNYVDFKAKNAPLALENGRGKQKQRSEKKGKNKATEARRVNDNNRPLSMETKTTQIEHDDGTIETITEVTITRPDGSRETMRRTDHPEKCTRNWTHPKPSGRGKNHKVLTRMGQQRP